MQLVEPLGDGLGLFQVGNRIRFAELQQGFEALRDARGLDVKAVVEMN